MRHNTSHFPRNISGVAYLSGGGSGNDAGLITAFHLADGRLKPAGFVSHTRPFEQSFVSDSGTFVLLTSGSARLLDIRRQSFTELPPQEYRFFSPNDQWITANHRDEKQKDRQGLAIIDTKTWKPIWKEPGAFYPTWDRSGHRLVYFRFWEAGSYTTGFGFPQKFLNGSEAYRWHHTHLFVVDMLRPDKMPRRITATEANALVGPWFHPYYTLCLRHDSLANESQNAIRFAPEHRGVLITLSVLDEKPFYTSEGVLAPPHPPEQVGDIKHTAFFVDASGRVHRHENALAEPVVWSRDRVHIYGHWRDSMFGDGGRFYRFNVFSGHYDTIEMPQPYEFLVAFIER